MREDPEKIKREGTRKPEKAEKEQTKYVLVRKGNEVRNRNFLFKRLL